MSKKTNGEVIQYIRGYTEPLVEHAPSRFSGWAKRHTERLERLRALADRAERERDPEMRSALDAALEDASVRETVERVARPWGGWCLVFDCETTTDTRQALLYGFYEVHGMRQDARTRRARAGTLTREDMDQLRQAGVFYNPDELTPDEIETVRAYVAAHGLRCSTRAQFVDLLYRWSRRYGALLIAHNAPFDLSRLAVRWSRGGRGYRNGFALQLCACEHRRRDGTRARQCFKHPPITIKTIGHLKSFIQFALTPHPPARADGAQESSRYVDREKLRGRFLNTTTLAAALLGAGTSVTLEHLGELLNVPEEHRKKPQPEFTRPITWEQLDYAHRDVDATWWAYKALHDLYGRHGLSTPMWRIYSEASLGKSYLKEMGITPILARQPDFPKDVLGYGMAALYGARVECAVRLQPVEVEYDDFLSQYATVNALLGLQDLLLAKELRIRRGPEVTAEVRAFLQRVTLVDLQRPETWRGLRFLCLVRPDHDRLPFRTEYGPAGRNVALPLIEHGLQTWYALPDLIVSTLLTGKPPQVLDAIELVPSAERIETKPLALFGDASHTIDPQAQDIFAEVVSLRREIKERRDAAKASGNTEEAAQLGAMQLGLKLMASGTSYGIYVEVDEEDEYAEARPVRVHALSTWQTKTRHVEVAGSYAFPPIGALITSGGRLLLAIAEKLAADRGMGYAMMDTDGIALTRPDDMPRETFYRLAGEVREWFTPLSPYRGQPPLLELEEQNIWDGRREPLYFLGIADKRYVLYNLVLDPDGPIEKDGERYNVRIRKFSGHGLGVHRGREDYQSLPHIPEPCEKNVHDLGGPRWNYDIWYDAIVAIERGCYRNGHPLRRHPQTGAPLYVVPGSLPENSGPTWGANSWLMEPALYQVTISTWNLLQAYSSDYDGHLDDLRPFSFFTLLPGFTSSQRISRFHTADSAGTSGSDWLARTCLDLPSNQPFIGPYTRTPEALQTLQAQGAFGWYDKTTRQWRRLPPEVVTPTLAEEVEQHFQRPAYKSPTPRAAGRLPTAVIPHVDRIAVISKETNAIAQLTADESGDHLLAREAGMDGAQVYGVDLGGPSALKEQLAQHRLSDLQLASGLPRPTIKDLKSGKTMQPTPETVAALSHGLWLLDPGNPDGLAGWRDVPSSDLAESMGWARDAVQEVRNGTRGLTDDEQERFIATIVACKRTYEAADEEPETAAEQDVPAFVASRWKTAEAMGR
jgi:hypothetical protein